MSTEKSGLERKLGLFPVTSIVIANIIGAGIFTTTGYLMESLGNPLMMLIIWIVGGIIAFCGAVAFGELGAAFPQAGGEYIFISRIFHPLVGFLSGWLSLIVGFSAPIAASAIGFSKYLLNAFPGLQSHMLGEGILSQESFSRLLAILIIIAFTIIHARGVVFGARVQNGLTIMKVVLIVLLIIIGFAIGEGNLAHISEREPFIFDFSGWKSIGLSLMFIMFAYSGWNSATYIGSEIKNPGRVIPWSLLISTIVVIILYFFLNLYFVYSIPPSEMKGVPEIGGLAAGLSLGRSAQTVVSLLISFALFSSLSAFIILGPRVYYRMAKDGYFFKSIAKVHPSRKVPVHALILQGVIAIVLVMSGTFEQILIYMGFSLGIFPIIAVAGVFVLRWKGESKLKLPGFPWLHIIFILSGILMLSLAYMERPVESSIAILTALSGIPVFFWFKKRRSG